MQLQVAKNLSQMTKKENTIANIQSLNEIFSKKVQFYLHQLDPWWKSGYYPGNLFLIIPLIKFAKFYVKYEDQSVITVRGCVGKINDDGKPNICNNVFHNFIKCGCWYKINFYWPPHHPS